MTNTARKTAAALPTAIRKTAVAKHQPRTEAEPFDPSKVSTTLSVLGREIAAEAARVDALMGRTR